MDRTQDTHSRQQADDHDFEDASDRRSADRYRTVCRIARVSRADDVGLWRVRNISNAGMMLAADVPMTRGEHLQIALSESVCVAAKIVWVERGRCGVSFSEPINAAAVLHALAEEQRAEGYRALRLPIEAEAVLTLRNTSQPIDLVDISQHGAGFRSSWPLDPGAAIELLLPGGELRRSALIRWARGRRGGLWFTQPLDRADLESIARLRR